MKQWFNRLSDRVMNSPIMFRIAYAAMATFFTVTILALLIFCAIFLSVNMNEALDSTR